LLRWRTHERATALRSVDAFLTEIAPRAEIFPKMHRDLAPLYDVVSQYPTTLGDMLSREKTPHELVIPSTPRYFISALKTRVDRASVRRVYFPSEHARNIAYLFLNSSYMYWWWRLHDGGMTIAERTLHSLPIDTCIAPPSVLLTALEHSETVHKVVKKNAGRANENVKHPMELVRSLNEYLFPEYSSQLEQVHSNSCILLQYSQPMQDHALYVQQHKTVLQ